MRALHDLPLLVLLMGIGALSMLIPGGYAIALGDNDAAHAFGLSAVLFFFLTAILGIALHGRKARSPARSHLAALVAAYTLLPLMLAVPFQESLDGSTYMISWFEMVSSITTTGASLFEPWELSRPLHLWRALVGWMGGFLVWVTAFALLAPMNLGGFEVISSERVGMGARSGRRYNSGAAGITARDPRERLLNVTMQLLPIYAGLTLILCFGLLTLGDTPLVALCHAMSTLATSGISPVGGMAGAQSGLWGEGLIFLYFVFALSRMTFAGVLSRAGARNLRDDPELRIGLSVLLLVPGLLFLRHWIGAYEVDAIDDLGRALSALWGATFSVMSFLSTAGFVSSEWEVSSAWSGLQTPGLVLLALALIGGGVATTAGGVKLVRVYALYLHSAREMEKLVYPSSVGGAGQGERRFRRQGAYVAWIFFMLFALSLATVSLLLTVRNVPFDEALVFSIAALSNTGPAANVVLDHPVYYADLGDPSRVVLALAMALGRLETLALLALFNPQFWRR
jgi:trk system potassium uptake protein TrkH